MWNSASSSGPTLYCRERTVTKKEIVKQISEVLGLTQLKTKEIVQKTFDAIIETLLEERYDTIETKVMTANTG